MDNLSTPGPLALGLLTQKLGLTALMIRRTGPRVPNLGRYTVALSLVSLHVCLGVETGDLSTVQDTARAFALSAAALVFGILVLSITAWFRARY